MESSSQRSTGHHVPFCKRSVRESALHSKLLTVRVKLIFGSLQTCARCLISQKPSLCKNALSNSHVSLVVFWTVFFWGGCCLFCFVLFTKNLGLIELEKLDVYRRLTASHCWTRPVLPTEGGTGPECIKKKFSPWKEWCVAREDGAGISLPPPTLDSCMVRVLERKHLSLDVIFDTLFLYTELNLLQLFLLVFYLWP